MSQHCETDATIPFRHEAWKRAIEAFGTAYLFEQRVRGPRARLKWITWLGLALPLSLGGLAAAFGLQSSVLPVLVIVVGVLGAVQGALALWAVVAGWDGVVAYGLESVADNYRLAREYEQLASRGPSDIATRLAVLDASMAAREANDVRQGVTEAEKREGLRAALRQYQRPCSKCKVVPDSLEPSDCNICGNF